MRRFERPVETARFETGRVDAIPFDGAEAALADAPISQGSRALLMALLRTGTTRVFPGGGAGIEYGSLLKTAVRPDEIGEHVREAAGHLRERAVDFLLVPGLSGYAVGAMYAYAAGVPAVLLKKRPPCGEGDAYPAGSFLIPSYTGDGDVVISPDPEATRDIVAPIVARRLRDTPPEAERVRITLRCAGADDIIDKGTMALAVTERAPLFCEAAMAEAAAGHRRRTGDARPIDCRVEMVAWVTPLLKTYQGAAERMRRAFGVVPFAGIPISSIHLDPPAIGVDHLGIFAFRSG